MTTYLIRRFCFDENHPDHHKVIARGLTLEEAQKHCNDPSTCGLDENGNRWFDGYNQE